MNRLLSLDGGGMRGVFALAILQRVQTLLRERYNKPDLVLADYFNFIGGTSTGAIIAALLSWGRSVEEITEFYERFSSSAFQSTAWWGKVWSKYLADPIRESLRELFLEQDGRPALLGTNRLRTFLLVVLRNASTGSTWPLTNNPDAAYNRRDRLHSNLELPLWQLIRASTAAPTYFPCETVTLVASDGRERVFEFIDGGVSPHNNPSLLMYLYATLPQYRMNFAAGVDNLYMLSVGTGSLATVFGPGEMTHINRLSSALRVFQGLISAVNEQQDVMCRAIGRCVYGSPIDREVGDLIPGEIDPAATERFLYCRYNYTFTDDDCRRAHTEFGSHSPLALDDLRSVPLLRQLGAAYANDTVRTEHFPQAPLFSSRLARS
jgi:predicted acylesterase/phospholipase RssA